MDDRIFIEGGHQLKGNVSDTGLQKCSAAYDGGFSCCTRGVSVLKGCPRIADVFCMEEILQSLGAVTWWEDHDLYHGLHQSGQNTEVPFCLSQGRMRSSVILLGALLGTEIKKAVLAIRGAA